MYSHSGSLHKNSNIYSSKAEKNGFNSLLSLNKNLHEVKLKQNWSNQKSLPHTRKPRAGWLSDTAWEYCHKKHSVSLLRTLMLLLLMPNWLLLPHHLLLVILHAFVQRVKGTHSRLYCAKKWSKAIWTTKWCKY